MLLLDGLASLCVVITKGVKRKMEYLFGFIFLSALALMSMSMLGKECRKDVALKRKEQEVRMRKGNRKNVAYKIFQKH